VLLHGHLRATRDLDLIVGLEPANCRRSLDALSGVGLRPRLPIELDDFADPAKRHDWHDNRNRLVLQLWDPSNEARAVEVFVTEPIAFEELEAEAVQKDLDGIPVRIASIRHLIQMKRSAKRRRHLDDIGALNQVAVETGVPTE